MAHTAHDVLRQRLTVQSLVDARPPARASDVVSLLACVQSQEYAHGFWSLGMRTSGSTFAEVQREFDAGEFVRTHILRPTWHFVVAADLRWIQALTAPRVHRINRSVCRGLGLEERDLGRGCELIAAALAGGTYLTRPELAAVLAADGLPATGQGLAYLVMTAELDALICSGPMRGASHTYALVEERLPPAPSLAPEEALAELARRYFVGHGPSSVHDLARWASLTLTDARLGLLLAADRLERVVVDDLELWFDPAPGEPAPDVSAALLLPLYDEALLSYPGLNFPVVAGHPHRPEDDLLIGSVIVDAVNVGLWRRTVRGRRVEIETRLAPGLSAERRAAVADAVVQLAAFLEKDLVVVSPE